MHVGSHSVGQSAMHFFFCIFYFHALLNISQEGCAHVNLVLTHKPNHFVLYPACTNSAWFDNVVLSIFFEKSIVARNSLVYCITLFYNPTILLTTLTKQEIFSHEGVVGNIAVLYSHMI